MLCLRNIRTNTLHKGDNDNDYDYDDDDDDDDDDNNNNNSSLLASEWLLFRSIIFPFVLCLHT